MRPTLAIVLALASATTLCEPGLAAEPRKSYNEEILHQLRQIKALGFSYADPSKALDVPARSYRCALLLGVQPSKAGPLLEAVRLFDVYAAEQLGAGRKSLAYKLTFRAPDRTLTVEEAVAARDAAVAVAAERFGATLRGA